MTAMHRHHYKPHFTITAWFFQLRIILLQTKSKVEHIVPSCALPLLLVQRLLTHVKFFQCLCNTILNSHDLPTPHPTN